MTSETFAAINPATGREIERFPAARPEEIERALVQAAAAARAWRSTPLAERCVLLRRCADGLRARREPLAATITAEMGKTLAEARGEIDKCAWNCEHVAEHAEAWMADERLSTDASEAYVSFLPLGVVFAVMPWNFPVWQIFRFLPAALVAGNAVVLKHAPNVLRSATDVQALLEGAGAPLGLFQSLALSLSDVPAVIKDDRIAAVTLTGSARAGASVASLAGAALKKSVLELGGSDPFVVLPDADVDAAAAAAVKGRFANCGQICIAPKRFILHEAVADAFIGRFDEITAQLEVGDPAREGVAMGPLARADLRDEIDGVVRESVAAGAKVLRGGAPLDGPGCFYAPTVLVGVTPEMAAGRKETFGPVAAMMVAKDVDDAVRLANDTAYGLSSNIWTRDLGAARSLARRMEAGGVFVNGVSASDPRAPVGGVKQSGWGRELGPWGVREFVNTQTVSIR